MIRRGFLLMAVLSVLGGWAHGADSGAAPGLPNPFFAMDTGTKDDQHATPEAQAALLEELGYAGLGYSGFDGLAEVLAALDQHHLKLFTIYMWGKVEPEGFSYQPGLKEALPLLQGRGVLLWITISSNAWKLSDPEADARAAEMLREIADLAAPAGARVALYPHSGCWLESAGDALRVAQASQRRNVGATFNLCHWLKINGPENLEPLLQQLAPRLFAVTLNGADPAGDWEQLIQPLDRGLFDVGALLKGLANIGYTGPIGLQGYGVTGPVRENLGRSMTAWRALTEQAAATLPPRISLDDLGAFQEPAGEWTIVADTYQDPADEKRLASDPGPGVAFNGPNGRTNHLVTKAEYGDVALHLEFMVPKGSNSGVYFQGRYEVQILDSWGVEPATYTDCGGIYQRWHEEAELEDSQRGYEGRAPRVNASRPPGEWQSFDVVFRAPRFDAAGQKIANAIFEKVVHNGVVIHENQELTGPTRAALFPDEKPTGPLMLQGDHGPVAYRNILVRPLAAAVPAATAAVLPGDEVFAALKTYDYGQSRAGLVQIEQSLTGSTPEQESVVEGRLLEVLEAPEATFAAKQFACKLLARVGGAPSVPVLATLLPDEKLSHMACYALQPMPDPAADQALIAALPQAGKPEIKIGLINVLGERRKAENAAALRGLVADPDPLVAAAALDALAKIGGPQALEAAREARSSAVPQVASAAARALLACANRMLENKDGDQGAALFDELFASASETPVRAAALHGRVLARGESGAALLVEALSGDDPALNAMGLRLARELPGPAVTEQLAGLLMALAGEKKALLLDALADRGDKTAAPAVTAVCMDENTEVRAAALAALGVLGDSSSVSMLAAMAAMGEGKDTDAARASLAGVTGDGVNAAILKEMEKAPARAQVELIKALAARQATEALPVLLKKAEDPEAAVRDEAWAALTGLAGSGDVSALLKMLLGAQDPAVQAAAEKAVVAAAQRGPDVAQGTAAVVSALSILSSTNEIALLLRVLGAIGDASGLDALRGACSHPAPEAQDAAVRALAAWPSAEVLPDLLGLAKNPANPTHQVLALRGFIRLLGLPSERAADEVVKDYAEAMALAAQAEEKRQVLAGVSGVAAASALDLAEASLADAEVQGEAAAAVIKIAGALLAAEPARVQAAMQKVLDVVQDETLRGQAQSLLVKVRLQSLQSQNIAPQGQASSPDDLNKDGGAGEDAAAIDGNPDTYWDETDDQPRYRFLVTFPEPKEVGAISILGHAHHNYAPKDFSILGDGQVLKTVTDAVYGDNLLFVEVPKAAYQTIELDITGCYGRSPGIRELGIYSATPAVN
jgi:sugar phosphate isomerase/epimerase